MRWRTRPTATTECTSQTVMKAEKMVISMGIVEKGRIEDEDEGRMSQGNDDEEDKGERNERIRGR